GKRGTTSRVPAILTSLCGLLTILSLAGPVWSKLPQPVYSSTSALVIALDLSRSMNAADISPSRLGRARYKIRDILNRRPDGQTALLAYAGDAFTVTPLTDDTATIASQLKALTTDIMPVQGNRTDLALKHAEDLLKQAGAGRGDILLITDEVDLARAGDVAEKLKGEGYRVSVLGVGTRQGAPIPLANGCFLKDNKGQIVIPTLDQGPMRELASEGGGIYLRMQLNDSDLNRLLPLFSSASKDAVSLTKLKTDVWREQGPWLLLPLLLLAALAFRRGYILVLACLLLPLPRPAQAYDWDSLWLRSDQRAEQALKQGQDKQAAGLFKDPAWKGVAQYRSGDYDGAVKSLKGLGGADNLYNLGNALARSGRYQAAINAYDRALKLDPDHADAKYNKKLIEDYLKRQRRKRQQQQGQNQKGQKKQKQGQNQKSGKNGGKNQQDQQGRQKQDRSGQNRQQAQQQQHKQQGARQSRPQEPSPQNGSMKKGEENQRPKEAATSLQDLKPNEQQQAVDQWLRRIPDDPSGLLRRKFQYQYEQRQRSSSANDKTW
ncbi:MAG: VWA domain-containing protein, partial [Gammaproteobacteria bacterium]